MQILATTLSVKEELGMKEKNRKIMWYKTENLVYVNDEEIKRTIVLCEKKIRRGKNILLKKKWKKKRNIAQRKVVLRDGIKLGQINVLKLWTKNEIRKIRRKKKWRIGKCNKMNANIKMKENMKKWNKTKGILYIKNLWCSEN